MNRILIKPADGMRVKNPARPGIPELRKKGESVLLDTYWAKRIAAGEVILLDAPQYVFERFGLKKPEQEKKKPKQKKLKGEMNNGD